MAESKTDKWIAALKPVFGGLVTLMAAAALWLNHSGSESCEIRYSQLDKRLSLTEQKVTNLQANQTALSGKIDRILESVQMIQIDITRMATVIDNTTVKRK